MKLPVTFRRSSLLTKVVVLAVVIASAALLVSQQSQVRANEAKAKELEDQITQLQQENQNLQSNIDGLGTDDSIRKIAQDELGLVDSDQIIITDVGE